MVPSELEEALKKLATWKLANVKIEVPHAKPLTVAGFSVVYRLEATNLLGR